MTIKENTKGEETSQQHHVDPSHPENNFCSLIWLQVSMIWGFLINNGLQLFADSGVSELVDRIIRKAAQHPFITVAAGIVVLTVGLPLLVITMFVLATVTLTFSGFVLVEGTLISISSILLFGCLGAMIIVFMFFAGAALASYFGFLHIYDLYVGLNNKTALTSFLKREQRNES